MLQYVLLSDESLIVWLLVMSLYYIIIEQIQYYFNTQIDREIYQLVFIVIIINFI